MIFLCIYAIQAHLDFFKKFYFSCLVFIGEFKDSNNHVI